MTQRRRQNDTVTIVYPQGCREISEELGSDELIRRLKSLAHTFQALGQAEDGSTYSEFAPLAIHLADEYYLNHQSRDVQLLVACCVADILRIYAPEAPYKDPAQIKIIFYFLIKQLGGLRDPKDPAFKRYFYLLENLAYVKSFNMCFELEDFNEIFCALFSLIFKIVNDEHSSKVKTFMLDILSPLITEADFVSNELLDIVLINIVEPYKTQRKNAYYLSKELIGKTSDTLAPYIQQFFNQVLILGRADVELNITSKVYDLIYELNNVSPSILLAVLPQLEFKLKGTEESERMGSVSLLARMFSEKGSDLASNHRPLWMAFLGRYNDISVAIRTKCVQYTMHFLINHPELQEDIVETLKARQHDSEENVRYEVVMAIVSTARRDFDIVSQSEDLLNFVKERTLDKKFKIRKEAMSGLAMIYKKHLSDPNNMHEATKKAVTWIKDKILHGYYMPGLEDRLLVERLLNMCLVPFNLESEERMKKLFLLFSTIDEYASKALIEVQKHQLHVRKAVVELLPLYRQPKSDHRDKEIQVKVHGLSKFLPEPMKAQEFLKRLSSNLATDNRLLASFEKVVDPDISCKECQVVVNQILKKMGSPIMTNLYYGTVKQLLERISSVMIDREAIQHLVMYVKSALQGGSILNELNLEPAVAAERGLRLLYVLACVFPAHFEYKDILKELLGFLSIPGEQVGPLVLSCLTFVGRTKPMEDHFPDLLETLVPICKAFVRTGTPRQAKQAIKCLHTNVTSADSLEAVFGEILDTVKANLNGPRGDAFLTAIVAAGHVAHLMPRKFPVQVKNIVSRDVVKQVMMQELSEMQEIESTWVEFEDLGLETRCKFQAMKTIARWLTGLKNDSLSARKTFRMLNAIIASKGNLLEDVKESQVGCAWLRLGAGCAMLKICEQKGVGDEYTVEQFYNLSLLVTDDVKEVRQLFIMKLQKGLSRGVPFKCLPLDFMGFYALVGFETDKKIKEMTKKYVIADITRRREYIKTSQLSGAASEQLPNIQPDYILLYAIAILTHFPSYESHKDVETLESMKSALWYVLEPLMLKTDSFFYGFYKQLMERMKNHTVASDPNSELLNQKMWALCDLSHSLIMTKATNFELQELPVAPSVSRLHFTPHPDAEFVNQGTYIPNELMAAPKAKSMYTVGHRKGGGRATTAKPSEQQRLTEPENGKESNEVVMEEGDENNGSSSSPSSSSAEKRLRLDEQSGDERPTTRRTAAAASRNRNN